MLVGNWQGGFTLTDPDGARSTFSSLGVLTARFDRAGNKTTYSYIDANGDGTAAEISQITDGLGKEKVTGTKFDKEGPNR